MSELNRDFANTEKGLNALMTATDNLLSLTRFSLCNPDDIGTYEYNLLSGLQVKIVAFERRLRQFRSHPAEYTARLQRIGACFLDLFCALKNPGGMVSAVRFILLAVSIFYSLIRYRIAFFCSQ